MQPDPQEPGGGLDDGGQGPRRTDEATEADAGLSGGATTPPGAAPQPPHDTGPEAAHRDDERR